MAVLTQEGPRVWAPAVGPCSLSLGPCGDGWRRGWDSRQLLAFHWLIWPLTGSPGWAWPSSAQRGAGSKGWE